MLKCPVWFTNGADVVAFSSVLNAIAWAVENEIKVPPALRIMLSPPRMCAVYRLPTTFKVADAQSLPVFGSLICCPD